MADSVNHPSHYNSHPSGIECIEVVRHHNFNVGNAIKYLWRLGLKPVVGKTVRVTTLQDLRKAAWYIEDEIARIELEAVEDDTKRPVVSINTPALGLLDDPPRRLSLPKTDKY